MRATGLKMPPVQYDVVLFKGGLDQITPTLSLSSGVARDAVNFECSVSGGYSRIAGYERYDGRPSPADMSGNYLAFSVSGSTFPALGSTITGGTSGATATLIYNSGSYYVMVSLAGTFTTGENLMVGATFVGAYTGHAVTTPLQDAQNTARVADYYRTFIQKPTGSGPVRGAFVLGDVIYCFRDNAGATACNLWKATAGGWSQINYEYKVAFSNANVSVEDGDTLTQGAVTATIRRVMVQTGTLVSGTNTGLLVISVPSGGSFAAGAATSTGGGALTLSGAHSAITRAAGGKYEIQVGNFTGRSTTMRAYGANGVDQAFEFDGSYFCPIASGMPSDTPKHLAIFKNQLFLSFGSSALHSGVGLPYNYTSTAGASEIAVGDTITGYIVQPGAQNTAAMVIATDENIFILYGTSAANWNLVAYNTGVGANDYTLQNMNASYMMSPKGIAALSTSLNYGNFDQSTLTSSLLPFIKAKRHLVSSSALCREKSQYRVFFTDGSGLYLTIVNGQYLGALPVQFPNYVFNTWESQLSTGDEMLLACGSDGYLYRMERGTSFDGASIEYRVKLNFNSSKSPRMLKRYRHAALEVSGNGYADFSFTYDLAYASTDVAQPGAATYSTNFAAPKWDVFVWDNFTWDGATLAPNEIEMTGTGENVACYIYGNNAYSAPFTINSLIIHYSIRRGLR